MSQYLGQEKRSKWNIDYYALINSLEINIRIKGREEIFILQTFPIIFPTNSKRSRWLSVMWLRGEG